MPAQTKNRRPGSAKRTSRSAAPRTAARPSSRKTSVSSPRGAAKTAPARKSAAPRKRAGKSDALAMLKDDHDRVDKMFKRYERMKEGDARKDALREEIVAEVRVHARLEEEIFYPALRAAAEGKEKEAKLLAEAHTEHDTVKWLMAELEGGKLDETTTDAHVKVMAEYIRHHVEEEEGEIFKAARRAGLDFDALGAQMQARKRELEGEASDDVDSRMAAMGVLGSDAPQHEGARSAR